MPARRQAPSLGLPTQCRAGTLGLLTCADEILYPERTVLKREHLVGSAAPSRCLDWQAMSRRCKLRRRPRHWPQAPKECVDDRFDPPPARPRCPASRHPAGARRHDPLPLRRDVRSLVHDAGLHLRHDGGRGSALQGRRPGLHLFALLQPDRGHVRGPHGADRRRAKPRAPRPAAWRPSRPP